VNVKERRKAIGWTRKDLAHRTGVNSAAIAMIERGEWSEEDALTRVAFILAKADEGELDVVLPPPEQPKD